MNVATGDKPMIERTAQGLLADAAAAASAGGAVASWIATANDILQLVATGIACLAGVAAWRYHRARREYYMEKLNDKRDKDESE